MKIAQEATVVPRADAAQRTDRRDTTRKALIRAAGEVFAARGFHGATLDQVAAAAGLTKGAVYYNFASKDELFLTLLQDRLDERLRGVQSIAADPTASRPGRAFFAELERDTRWTPLFFEFVAYAAREGATGRAFARRFIERTRASLAVVIDQALKRAGLSAPLPAEHLAIAVAALANGLALERLFSTEAVPDDLLDDVLGLLLEGLAARSANQRKRRPGRRTASKEKEHP